MATIGKFVGQSNPRTSSSPILRGKHAVVFGAGGSIGAAVAKEFAAEGAEAAGDVREIRPAANPVDHLRDDLVAPVFDLRHRRPQGGVGETRAGDEIGTVVEKWLNQFADVGGIELPVAVDVDDDVRPAPHRAFQAGAEDGAQSAAAFERMSRVSGGKAYFAKNWREENNAFSAIRDDLVHLYTLSYYPQANPNHGWRSIKVRLVGKDLQKYHIRTRDGYRLTAQR